MDSNSSNLSPKARETITNSSTILFLSMASVWELQLKVQLDRLNLRLPLAKIIQDQQSSNQIQLLSIALAHILELENLPYHHRDPFDRLLIAQARIEEMPIISRDKQFAQYSVEVIW